MLDEEARDDWKAGCNLTNETLVVVHITTMPETLVGLCASLISFQGTRGYQVFGVCGRDKRVSEDLGLGITCFRIPFTRTISPLRDLISLLLLTRLLRRIGPDVVHLHTPKAALLGGLAAVVMRVPVRLYTVRGLPFITARGLTRWVLLATEWISCACAQRVVAVSASVREQLLQRRLCGAPKLEVLCGGSSQGVDAEGRFNPERFNDMRRSLARDLGLGSQTAVLGFVGRLAPDKGIDELLQVWGLVSARIGDSLLLVLGEPDNSRGPVNPKLLEKLKQDPRIRWLGFVDKVEDYYRIMDVLVFPSYREGLPNVVLEAASMSVPCVGFDVVGTRDAIRDGLTGFLIPFGELDSMAASVLRLLEDPKLRKRLGLAAREWVRGNFRPAEIFRELDLVYSQELQKTDGSGPGETGP